jgi:hypothetical protein
VFINIKGVFMTKVVLLAFEGKDMCFIHALANALDMKEKGFDVKVILEGAATLTAAQMGKEDHGFHGLYKEVKDKGLIDCACLACSKKMGAYEDLQKQGIPFRGEMKGHPPLADYISQGYQVISF